MSEIIIKANSGCMELVHLHSSYNLNKKKWHKPFVTIYCSRAFLSPPSTIAIVHHLVKDKGPPGVAAALKTDPNKGITGDKEDLAARRQAFGRNTYPSPPTKTFLHFTLTPCKDPTNLLLLACAAISLAIGIKVRRCKQGLYDGATIFFFVFLIISISAITNFRQSRRPPKLSRNVSVPVVRSSTRKVLRINDVVVGDIVFLNTGDQVPADGLFLEGHTLRVENEIKSLANPFLFPGTKVAEGYGKMLVTGVGNNTLLGEMMSRIAGVTDQATPLQSRLNKLTSSILKLGLAADFLVFVVWLIRYFTGYTQDDNGEKEFNWSRTKGVDLINSAIGIIAAVIIAVVATPDRSPLALTLTFAYFMKRMMAEQSMVRKLSACETMGSATTICTDNTGTLTMNKMKVTKFWIGKDSFEGGHNMARCVMELLCEGVGLNTTGGVYNSGQRPEFSGSPTERAILSWAVLELGMDMEQVKSGREILHVEAFNSENKRSGVLMKRVGSDHEFHVHWKGAAEMILVMCSHYYNLEGEKKDLNDEERMQFNHMQCAHITIIQGMAATSLRCVAFAHRQSDDVKLETESKIQEEGMVLLGLVGLKDPCLPGVKKAVEDCQYAGVDVKMITGDNLFTAKAIATECGILRPGQDGCVVEGAEFRNYTDDERMERVEAIRAMARSSPFDKLLMVQCLKRKGHVVAVTGDGTNDAPALKEADIGLSIGIQGTELAKESSDIVIMDDNFASVVTVLKWGRCVYNNIQKFIQFQLTVNVAALTVNFVAAVSAGEVPLTAVQLLWVNLIMDTLGALALATERPTRELMERKPVGRHEALISNVMWRNLMAQAVYQIVVLLVLQFRGEGLFGVSEKVKNTLIFNAFVMCQVFNEFNARKLEKRNVFEGLHKNKVFVGIVGVTVVLQVVMVELLNKFADTERLNLGEWGICVGIGALSWPIAWVVKLIPVPQRPFFSYVSFKKLRGA